MPKIDLASLAGMVQQHISRKYAAALIDRTKVAELKAYIAQYLYDTGFTVDGYTEKALAERLYSEMAEYSVLTHYLDDPDVEEINVNGWDDIAITHLDGRIEKTKEHFFSPQHAEDVVKKLLQHSGMIIDNASPLAQGHLPNNTRITAVKKPVVDEERAIAVSIRKLYPQRVDRDNLIRTNTLTEEMLGFLETCIRYGVSFVVAGRTSSGKTTLLNALLAGIPDNKRIYTIESGARELSLVKRNGAGEVINNVVHTISRPSDNEAYNITQAQLLMAALRFDPDIICVGEMRDREAYSAIEASSTDHTVVSTMHGGGGRFAHRRLSSLKAPARRCTAGTAGTVHRKGANRMTVVYIISFLLIAFGIVRILGLTPESIGADVSAILDRKKSLRDNAMRARGKKRTNKLVLWLDKIRRALSDTGKEKSFGVACAVALLLMILGCVGAIVIGNPFLAPVLAIALAMIPFLYLLRTVEQYEEQVKLELETGLSAITSSYERTMNLKNAVEENIDNLKPPVKGLFQSFLVEISVINPDVKAAICHLRERVKDCVWEEWCDTLISCQDDSQLIGTLYPVVEKLTDMRIVNAELKVMISENKREYYIMALMVVANIPLLYFLNKEWYGALMYTTFGKVTLAICGAVMLFTFLRMQKYCKPVEYRR